MLNLLIDALMPRNAAQWKALARTLLTIAGSALVAHGVGTANDWNTITNDLINFGMIVVPAALPLIAHVWSMLAHKEDPSVQS
jgi:hypothetical protein